VATAKSGKTGKFLITQFLFKPQAPIFSTFFGQKKIPEKEFLEKFNTTVIKKPDESHTNITNY